MSATNTNTVDDEVLRKALSVLNGRYRTPYLYRPAKQVLTLYFQLLEEKK
jgi:hypothetical protein